MNSDMPSKHRTFFVLFALTLVGSLYFHANIGGSGMRIPNNILVWLFGSLIGFYGLYRFSQSDKIILPRFTWLLLAFPVMALLSGVAAGVVNSTEWFLRLFYIWGGVLFFFALFQFNFTPKKIDQILLWIILASVLHAIIGIAQILYVNDLPGWLPVNQQGDPTGTFQQINNHASFQVTSLMLVFWLLTRPITKSAHWSMTTLLSLAIFSSTFIVSFSGSRVAILGFLLAFPLFVLSRWKYIQTNKKRWGLVILVMSLAIIATHQIDTDKGLSSIGEKTAAMNSGYSGDARLGIYTISFDLVKESPIYGHGIGSFARVWQLAKPDFYAHHPDATLPKQRVSHPHNEIIYWLVEGGLLAGIGLILFGLALLKMLWHLPISRRYAYAALLLPIILHTQVELPFYISSLHWFVMLFLLFVGFYPSRVKHEKQLSIAANTSLKGLSVISGVVAVVFFTHSMLANLEFRDYLLKRSDPEQVFDMAMENPYFRDLATQVTMSLLYEQSRQIGIRDNIEIFADWVENELKRNPHINLFRLAIRSRLDLKDEKKACALNERAQAIYPRDKGFNTIKDECSALEHA